LGKLFRDSCYVAWDRLVLAAVDRSVDFVTLAGDIFDSPDPTVRSRVVFREGLERLHEVGIPVYMTLGNHDPLMGFPQSLKSLPGLHVFGPDPQGTAVGSLERTSGVVIFGASFPKVAVTDNLVRRFFRDPGIDVAVGVLHANVQGDWGHRNYAPCTKEDLRVAGMDVWCLGHVHSPMILSEDPLIFYPGSAQGAHINETGPRGCAVVTMNKAAAQVEPLNLAPVRWEQIRLHISDGADPEQIIFLAEEACSRFSGERGSLEAVVARFTLSGTNSRGRLQTVGEHDDFMEILEERLVSLPVPVFPESVVNAAQTSVDLEALMAEDGFLAEYLKLSHKAALERNLRQELLAGVQTSAGKHVARRFLDGSLDCDRLISDPKAAARLLKRCSELVAHMFLDRWE
jgi:DNA repair exonuclease SbcCD nuclease subunit